MIYKYYYRRVYKYVDYIHYPTQFIKDTFENVVGKTKGIVISNGVNDIYTKKEIKKPDKYKDKIIILNIARLSGEKNQKTLIKAINLSQYKNNIQLILAGSGPDKKNLYRLAKKLNVNLENNFYSREELVNIINYSTLYCHPSEMEIEAISCGIVPIISNSKKSATRFFALNNNCLFENRNAYDLASKIDYWLDNPTEREKCSQEYLNNKFKFNQEYCMNKMEEMIITTHNSK